MSKRDGLRIGEDGVTRCWWPGEHADYLAYHDDEWGVPVHDDRLLFEFLILEGAQAGLSWSTVLKKRENYRELFDQFDVEKIARYNKRKINELLKNPGIIRNRLKVNATVTNARAVANLLIGGCSISFARYPGLS